MDRLSTSRYWHRCSAASSRRAGLRSRGAFTLLCSATLAASVAAATSARAEEPPSRPAVGHEPAADPCAVFDASEGPRPASSPRLTGDATAYEPLVHAAFGRCMKLELPASIAGRVESVSHFPVDRYGNTFGGPSASPQLRLGARFISGMQWAPIVVLAETEFDLLTGYVAKDPGLAGDGFPASQGLTIQLRKLHARASLGRLVHLDLGAQTNHFGMGLVSNDGAHGWEPGSASFSDPRGGDRVLRAQLSTGPGTPLSLAVALGADKVIGDDALLPGDSARQLFGAVLAGVGKPTSGGAYVARRHQENARGRTTDVTILDLTGKTTLPLTGAVLGLETEWALITGTTQLGATVDHPEHDVLQLGGAARVSLDAGAVGTVIDFLYASGDQNPYDDDQNAFLVDPNYEFGLLLFRQVIAAQSARGAGTAADPQLVGVAPEDLERLATRGSVTNTVALFPKLLVRPLAGLEAYGGPLFALANVPYTDVFNTEITGGSPRGPLGAPAGPTFGVEFDGGVRYRALLSGSELTLGLEGGVLSPSSAFRELDGATMGSVYGGRAMARYRL